MPVETTTVDNENLAQIAQDVSYLKQYLEQQGAKVEIPVYDKQFNDTHALLQKIYVELEKQGIASTKETSNIDFKQLTLEVQKMNIHCQNIENITIPFLVGFGLVIGVLCALIFSNFARH